MTIPEAREKCKSLLARAPRDALIVAVVMLTSSASFGLGFLAGRDAGQGRVITIEESALATPPTEEQVAPAERVAGQVVASKNGTKYYPPDCAAAGRISDANKIWFASVSAAREAGYEPAANCKGL